jgi:hypothetical protein
MHLTAYKSTVVILGTHSTNLQYVIKFSGLQHLWHETFHLQCVLA